MALNHSSLDDLSYVLSYCYWSHFFTKGSGFDRNADMVRREGYEWPSPAAVWEATKNGRGCPFCHNGNDGTFFIEPITLQGTTISVVHCLCRLLPYMDTDYTLGDVVLDSPWSFISPYDIKTWGDKRIDAQNAVVLEGVNNFIHMPISNWVYLYGGLGAGKTMLAELVKTHFRGLALYLSMADFNDWVFRATHDQNLSELIDVVSNAEVLILDDVGAEYPSTFFYSSLYAVINRRYAKKHKAPTFFTSNFAYKQLAESSKVEIRRIADRIFDKSLTQTLVTLQPSWRQR